MEKSIGQVIILILSYGLNNLINLLSNLRKRIGRIISRPFAIKMNIAEYCDWINFDEIPLPTFIFQGYIKLHKERAVVNLQVKDYI